MAYTVRTPHGSLDFPSMTDIERAYRNGLVGPDDEIREHGKTEWYSARAHPLLRTTQLPAAARRRAQPTPLIGGVVMALVMAILALYLLAIGQWMFAFALAIAMSLFLMRFTKRSTRPRHSYARP